MVLLLLLFWASRLHEVLRLPLFLDEASHLTRAQWVWEGQPWYLLETGKALAPYLSAAFWPFAAAPFIGRVVVVLLGLIGMAAAYAVGRALHSREAGLLTMGLWIAAPQLFFFERMALTDGTLGAMAMLTLWLAIRTGRGGRAVTAALCGVALMLTVLAKLTGLVYLPIPALAAALVGCGGWRSRLRGVIITYVVFGLLAAPLVVFWQREEADPTGQSSGLTSTDPTSISARVERNLPKSWEAVRAYFGDSMLGVIGVACLAALAWRPRPSLLLLAQVVVPFAAIAVTAQQLWLRYLVPVTPFFLLAAAVGLVEIGRWLLPRHPGSARWLPRLVIGVWAVSVGLPFALNAYRDPAMLPLPAGDRFEYVEWIPSGYGIREAAAYLNATIDEPITVLGAAVNCNAARLYLRFESPVTLHCPSLHWGGDNPHIVADIRARIARDGVLYILSEDKAPPTIDVRQFEQREEIAAFMRPSRRNTVRLYRVMGGD
jgi:hypothetical protein